MPDEKSQRIGRERIARVFRYLKALNEHRNPAKRDLSEQPWTLWFRNLPDHPSIQRRLVNGKEVEEDDFVLKVGRPTLRTKSSSRSEEHTPELQSRFDVVCRLL